MRQLLRSLIGFVAALVCALALGVVLLGLVTLVREAADAHGDVTLLAARMGHYTDSAPGSSPGREWTVPVQSKHPLLQFSAGLLLSAMIAAGSGWFLSRRR